MGAGFSQFIQQVFANVAAAPAPAPAPTPAPASPPPTVRSAGTSVSVSKTAAEKDAEIRADADANVTTMTGNFNNEFANIETMNTFYNTELINSKNTQELYDIYLKKNKDLDKNIKEFHSDLLTNDRKTFYEMGALEVLVNWNYFFIYMYFTLFFAFVLGIVFSENMIPKYQSISFAIILGLYPFLISPIVSWVSSWVKYILNLYPKNVYNTL